MSGVKSTAYKPICLLLAAFIFFGTIISINGGDALAVEEYSIENKVYAESYLPEDHQLRPTREEIKEMEENAEKIKEDKWAKPIVILLCVVIPIVGLLMLLYPDFFIELSFFKYNQRNYWLGRGYSLNPTNADRIFTRILGGIIMLSPLIFGIIVYLVSRGK